MKWHTGLRFNVFLTLAELKPRRTQSLYFELQLHGSWGLHNCSGVPLKLHTPKTLCGCNKSCIPLPPSLMCAVPSGEITLPQMFVTTTPWYHLCNKWQTDACTHKHTTGHDNSCDGSTNNKTEPFKSLVKSCLRTKNEANDLQQNFVTQCNEHEKKVCRFKSARLQSARLALVTAAPDPACQQQ